jgi:uncharacterized protein YcbK (DUF882 family)
MKKLICNMLDEARSYARIPFKINSGMRCPKHNKKVGGKENSSHQKGCAADIHCTESRNRALIICSLLEAGLTRIGIGKTFIHVDNDQDKAKVVFWLY